ncbi:unnamed protein product [Sphagnum jensenii]|uniref:Uncharacterized protein n=1 Tax=Sphagnum jensenii TaxID=128206 RepID=A0ABP0ZYL1_9BRYO
MSNSAPNVTKTPHQRKIHWQNERRRRQSEQQQEREQQRLEQLAGPSRYHPYEQSMSNSAPNVTKTPHQRKICWQNGRRRRQSEQQQEREQQRLEQLAGPSRYHPYERPMSNVAPNVTKTPHQRKIRWQNERRRRQSE